MNRLLTALEKLQLTTKLLIGFSIGLVIAAAIGFNAISRMNAMSEQSAAMYEKDLLGISHLKEANINLIYMGRSIRQMMLAPDAAERTKARIKLDTATITLQKELDEARKRIFREDAKQLLAQFDGLFEQYKHNVNRAVLLMEQEDYRASSAAAYISSQEFINVINSADDTLTAMTRVKEKGARETAEALAALNEKSRNITILLILIGLAVGVMAGIVIGKSIQTPNERLRHSIEGLAAGKMDDAIPNTDYPNDIGAFARAIRVLQDVYRNMETQRWVKSHVAEISSKIQQADTFDELAKSLLSAACPLLGVSIGVLYLHEENQLQFIGSYGWRERKNLNQTMPLGEGLLGQSALERKPISITKPPEDYIKIGSALGETVPGMLMALPILHGEELLAMMELATLHPIGERETALLDALLPVIAMTLEILGKNLTAQQMMKEAQQRAMLMESQAAQLEEQSVEMEAQQSELLKTEEWYRRIVEAADALLVVDAMGFILLSNPKSELIFGFEAGTLAGQRIDRLLPSWEDIFQNHGETQGSKILEAIRMDGIATPIRLTLTRLPDLGVKGACTCLTVQHAATETV